MIQELFKKAHLTTQEQAVVDYIQQHPTCIVDHNAKELAKLTYVSSPTIIRLVKKLGFKGYLDFKLTYIKEYTLSQQEHIYQLNHESSIDDVINTLPHIYNQVFLGTKNMIQKESYVRVINYMLQAKQIDFYANDNNYSQVQSTCLKLNLLGIRAQAFNTINQHYVDTFQAQDVLSFVVSHSGRNQTMVDAAYYLRQKRARVIAITGMVNPTLQLICNESLYIDAHYYSMPKELLLYGLSITYILDILVTLLVMRKK